MSAYMSAAAEVLEASVFSSGDFNRLNHRIDRLNHRTCFSAAHNY